MEYIYMHLPTCVCWCMHLSVQLRTSLCLPLHWTPTVKTQAKPWTFPAPSTTSGSLQERCFTRWKSGYPCIHTSTFASVYARLRMANEVDHSTHTTTQTRSRPCVLIRYQTLTRLLHLRNQRRSSQMDQHKCVNFTTRTPLGVAGLITPWNLPLYLLTWKVCVSE